MEPEYFRADDVISLTPGEWQELVASIQNLMQANNTLLQTVSELMAQRNEAFSHQAPPSPTDLSRPNSPRPSSSRSNSSRSNSYRSDPYDLHTLNHLLSDKP